MENASKALIIAGSVLISLMVVSALLLMFNSLSSYQNTNQDIQRESQTVEFNNQYESFNKQNVRGNEIYSLLNKVVDYNRRQTTATTGWADQGAEYAYQEMTITLDLTNAYSNLSFDGTRRIFTQASPNYTIGGSSNVNPVEQAISNTIPNLEASYGQNALTQLAGNITNIYTAVTDQEKEDAVIFYNNRVTVNSAKVQNYEQLQQKKNDIYTYYEYIQFKRAYFNCTGTEYNQETGRIVSMSFQATGKFN